MPNTTHRLSLKPVMTLYRWRMQGNFLLLSCFGNVLCGGDDCCCFSHDASLLFGSFLEPSWGLGRPDAVEALGCELPLD